MELFNDTNIFLSFAPTSSHFHPLQIKHCDSNSWLVVDEDDNDNFRREKVIICCSNRGEQRDL